MKDTGREADPPLIPRRAEKEKKMEVKFYRCAMCGQIVEMIEKKMCPVMCCGKPMEEIIPGTTDASLEKHVPVWEAKDGKVFVTVGAAEHPMLDVHYIEWIVLQTNEGVQRKALKPGDAPKAVFALLPGEEALAVYAYCNLHSLWKG